MTQAEVVTWDATSYQPPEPETWVQIASSSWNVKVCGGLPDVIAATNDAEYRHSADGRLWKRPCTQ